MTQFLSRRSLLIRSFAPVLAGAFLFGASNRTFAAPDGAPMQIDAARRLSAPAVHDNLAIYFVHGPSAGGPAPLTLAEAIERGSIRVYETGNVNSLQVENTGSEPVFIQSGDIVKGGKQDRVLTVSMVVPGQSGKLSIASYCVERGRWSPRGKEQASHFHASTDAIPSRVAKLAMKAPPPPREAVAGQELRGRPQTMSRQSEVWNEVARKQAQLARSLGAPVSSPQSQTSLQLTLENDRLKSARRGYVEALRKLGEGEGDIIGYVFAINGKINSADIYGSNALFRKMWPKMLEASVTEALGEKPEGEKFSPPDLAAVAGFIRAAEAGPAKAQDIAGGVRLETRENGGALAFDTRTKAGGYVHRNYLRSN